jgi:hypothetical protein
LEAESTRDRKLLALGESDGLTAKSQPFSALTQAPDALEPRGFTKAG